MGFLKNSTYYLPSKYIKFNNSNISIIDSAKTIGKIELNDLLFKYDQFIHQTYIIPKNTVSQELKLGNLNNVITLVVIKVTYDKLEIDDTKRYCTFSYDVNSNNKIPIDKFTILSGISSNNIHKIYIDNPSTKYPITLEIFACTTNYADSNLLSYDVYIDGITFNAIQTYTQGQTIALYNSANTIVTILNLEDIQNVSVENDMLVIDDTSVGNIALKFTSNYHLLQSLSAINWLLNDTVNRSLPQTADTTAPVITYINVTSRESTLLLTNYLGNITKTNIVTHIVNYVTDNRDGTIANSSIVVTITRNGINFNAITVVGIYNVQLSITDTAGNNRTESIILNVN